MEPFRSQGGKLIFLASPGAWDEDEFSVVLLSFGSNALKRVVRSTIQAEAYNLQQVVEEADILRAALVDTWGLLNRHDWEASAATHLKSVWFTDCKSVETALSKPIVRSIDKRLGIELASLRQQLWRFIRFLQFSRTSTIRSCDKSPWFHTQALARSAASVMALM